MQKQQREQDFACVDIGHAPTLGETQRIVVRRQSKEHANHDGAGERQPNRKQRERMNQNDAEVELITHFCRQTKDERESAGAEHPRHTCTRSTGPLWKARRCFVQQQTVKRC
jgi:hypothetical protein